jgi:hypothetical protein
MSPLTGCDGDEQPVGAENVVGGFTKPIRTRGPDHQAGPIFVAASHREVRSGQPCARWRHRGAEADMSDALTFHPELAPRTPHDLKHGCHHRHCVACSPTSLSPRRIRPRCRPAWPGPSRLSAPSNEESLTDSTTQNGCERSTLGAARTCSVGVGNRGTTGPDTECKYSVMLIAAVSKLGPGRGLDSFSGEKESPPTG